jgi:hypothetical protein
MRKRILDSTQKQAVSDDPNWLNLDSLADVEVTSEDPEHPIEAALLPNRASGWRAGGLGDQTIRLFFSSPQRVRRIRLSLCCGGRRMAERRSEISSVSSGTSAPKGPPPKWKITTSTFPMSRHLSFTSFPTSVEAM